MSYQVFVAVSTGQQVANLPPILEYALSGDHVLWLESDQSIRSGCISGACQVLETRGLKTFSTPIVGDMDEPATVAESLISAPESVGIQDPHCRQINIVLNGGKKLTPIGLVFAVQEMQANKLLGAEVCYLYGDHQRAQMKIHHPNIMDYQAIEGYSANRMLSIEEIFTINGLSNPHILRRWVWGHEPELERYGTDPFLTAMVHDCYVRGFDEKIESTSKEKDENWPAYGQWIQASKDTWKLEVIRKLEYLGIPVPDCIDDLGEYLAAMARRFKPRLVQRELSNDERDILLHEQWIDDANRMRIGLRFELAVWRRSTIFLHANPSYKRIVKECLLSVQIDRDGRREKDLDVALVLTNGILIHLECKTWEFKKKDADARLQVLQRASSRLANMYAVAPLFPSLADAYWFPAMHTSYEELTRNLGPGKVFAYTMANPPDKYEVYLKKKGAPTCFNAPPSFEDSLRRILDSYLPPN